MLPSGHSAKRGVIEKGSSLVVGASAVPGVGMIQRSECIVVQIGSSLAVLRFTLFKRAREVREEGV
jgi:hypothetical protein